jgi:hypothetical protein
MDTYTLTGLFSLFIACIAVIPVVIFYKEDSYIKFAGANAILTAILIALIDVLVFHGYGEVLYEEIGSGLAAGFIVGLIINKIKY